VRRRKKIAVKTMTPREWLRKEKTEAFVTKRKINIGYKMTFIEAT